LLPGLPGTPSSSIAVATSVSPEIATAYPKRSSAPGFEAFK
jgi:hypothetical protein